MAMKVIQENLWLCNDCLMAAVNGDFTGLDYHYGAEVDDARVIVQYGPAPRPEAERWFYALDLEMREHYRQRYRDEIGTEADQRRKEIEAGLETLGAGLVPDFRDETEYVCDCGWRGTAPARQLVEDEMTDVCPTCQGDVTPREEGIQEFSSLPCDCCNSNFAGARHRFAILDEVNHDHA